jgi:hypothetical protein
METPLVREQIRPLEPVGPDPFIDGCSAHGVGGGVSYPLDERRVVGVVEEEARGVQHLPVAQALEALVRVALVG